MCSNWNACVACSNSSTSDMENNSDEEFFDAEMEGEWSVPPPSAYRPIVMSVPVSEGDPSDIEEDEDYDEEDNTSGKCCVDSGILGKVWPEGG